MVMANQMIKTNPHSLQIAHIPHGRTSRASLHIIAHKISFFDVIKLIVNFFLYFRSLNDLKCIDYEKENQHHLRTIGLAT